VDAGTALFIYQGDTIVHITDFYGSAPDMGAYEFMTTVSAGPVSRQSNTFDFKILPNFSGSKIIKFESQYSEQVILTVYDIMGRSIEVINKGVLPAGEHKFSWDHSLYRTGIYIIRLTVGNNAIAKKVLVK
jgi:hypothetical protein